MSDADRFRLESVAAEVAEAEVALSKARKSQSAVWAYLIEAGVSKTAIAAHSDVTRTAINMRLAQPPSRKNRKGKKK